MNKKYKLIIFDLDGTLADTSEGIYNAHRYTMAEMQIPMKEELLDGVIGGELLQIYRSRFGLSDEDARKAVDIYRKWYQESGVYQVEIYSDMRVVLEKLKNAGFKLAVATLKREDFAKIILEDMKIAKLFDFIYGMDEADTLNKEKLLRKCVESTGVLIGESLLIGDSLSDSKGASACQMDFLGVTYGFGFQNRNQVLQSGAVGSISEVKQLLNILI